MNDSDIGRERLLQIFRFLQAFNERKNPPKRQIREQPPLFWLRDLPIHDCVQLSPDAFQDSVVEEDEALDAESWNEPSSDFILRVRRPTLSPCPLPPIEIVEWLKPGWDNPDREVGVEASLRDEEGEGEWVRFEDDSDRQPLYDLWLKKREQWAPRERPARAAMDVFERLYEVHATVERESEQVELVLGDGILNWRRQDGGMHHPILLQRVQIEFDPDVPEFRVEETESAVELYTSLFRSITELDGQIVERLRREVEGGFVHPLSGERTSEWLEGAVHQMSPHGEYLGDKEPTGEEDHPRLGRHAVIFLRRRVLGFSSAVEAILEDLPKRKDIPPSLLRIAGIHTSESEGEADLLDEKDILLTKPANQEQLRIAQRLAKHRAVLVQGPPGTGKTHTIANLIGHLLAQGKKVLVTSHTTKALRVLRDQVDEELRPLCVSVLDTDIQSRAQLEEAIQGTVGRLSDEDNIDEYRQSDRVLAIERNRLLSELHETRERLLHARNGEYREIVLDGRTFAPSDAARHVATREEDDAWIPGPVAPDKPIPLSTTEIKELYRTNLAVTIADEGELNNELPDPREMPSAEEFSRIVHDLQKSEQEPPSRNETWNKALGAQDLDELAEVIGRLERELDDIKTSEDWRLAAMDAGLGDDPEAWNDLIAMIVEADELRPDAQRAALEFNLERSSELPLGDQVDVLEEIIDRIGEQGRVGWLGLTTKPRWRRILSSVSVDSESPRNGRLIRALLDSLRLERARERLCERWKRQMEPLGATSLSGVEYPERIANEFLPSLETALAWGRGTWRPLEADLNSCGLNLERLRASSPPQAAVAFDVIILASFFADQVLPECRARFWELVAMREQGRSQRLREYLAPYGRSQVGRNLERAASELNAEAYETALKRLHELRAKGEMRTTRRQLLERLEKVAANWAHAIDERLPPHDQSEPPGDPAAAWQWRQLADELDRRNTDSLDELQFQLMELQESLERTTAALASTRTWTTQIDRTTDVQKQALEGFSQLMRKIGRGTGKRAPRLKAAAQKKLAEARDSVPVWIMPLSRVVESFDPATTEFDVVIIDEASQSDALALIALYMGKSVVVVGDHEQVTPDAIGERVEEVENLISTHLKGIPNAELYDGQLSIYHLAQAAFGGRIRLIEHFRCAPDIIDFSNRLSYDGAIRPLRDPGSIALHPHVVEHRVTGSSDDNNVNRTEAEAVAALLAATIEQPEYAGKSVGVISLVSSGGQARTIETLLIRHIPPSEFEQRRVLCGNPAQFQGDERDVIFLSLVDGPVEGGPLRLRRDERFKRRFNVAASRARDQMWLVHSLDPDTDLKAGDLRKRLIEHVRDPEALEKKIEDKTAAAESPFERRVLEKLVTAGYDVTPQYAAGYYRIDIVLKDQQIAIECDGDKFHPPEKLREDVERQAILERLGWRFVRIRGTQFYRDSDGTMDQVFERLRELGAEPVSLSPPRTGLDSNELIERVRRRAAEIRAEWGTSDVDLEDLPSEESTASPVGTSASATGGRSVEVLQAKEVQAYVGDDGASDQGAHRQDVGD